MARSTADKEEAAEMLAEAQANTKGPVLTPEQTLIVFALVSQQGFIAQNHLGVACEAADREVVERANLIETVKREQNALWLRLTEAGWSWSEENLAKAVPPSHLVVHHLMKRIGMHLEASGESLKDFIGISEPQAMDPELSA